jgi:hypothetical protein
MLIKRIDNVFSITSLQEDFRKLGVNFITAGAGALLIAHAKDLTPWVVTTSVCAIMVGILGLLLGTYRGSP